MCTICLQKYLNDGKYCFNVCTTTSGFAHLRKGREIILPSKAEKGVGKESYNVS